MSGPGDVPPEILDQLRAICGRLPETYEEPAWIGVRWRIRARTVAHVYTPDPERYPLYAHLATDGEPPTVMTFRAPVEDLLGLTAGGFPFFRAAWGSNVAGVVLGDHTDWAEIDELLTDSYCEMAPKFLAARTGNLHDGTNRRRVAEPMSGDSNVDANIAESSDEDGNAVLARVTRGMAVIDVNGEQAGTVGAVQLAGTSILPEAPLGIAEDLVDTGYVLIDGAGHLANDAYAGGDQIEDVSDVVTLNVRRLDLIRAESTTP